MPSRAIVPFTFHLSCSNSLPFSRRNSFSMEANQPPETLENILRVTRTQESVLNAYYTDSNGEVVTMTLYDISETDPTDILGDDVLNSGAASRAGSERRDSAASTSASRLEESRRYHFRSHASHSAGGQLDPQRVQEKLRKLSNMYTGDDVFDDFTPPTSNDENDSSENDDVEFLPRNMSGGIRH